MPMKEGCLSRKLQERKKEKHLIKSKLRRGKSSSTKNRNVTNQNVRDNSEETYKCGVCEFSSRHQESFQVYISEWFSMIRKPHTLCCQILKNIEKNNHICRNILSHTNPKYHYQNWLLVAIRVVYLPLISMITWMRNIL